MLFELTYMKLKKDGESILDSILAKNDPRLLFASSGLKFSRKDPVQVLIWACLKKRITLEQLLQSDYVCEGLANMNATEFIKVVIDLVEMRQKHSV